MFSEYSFKMRNISIYVVLIIFLVSGHVTSYEILDITANRFKAYDDIMEELLTTCHPDYRKVLFYDNHYENKFQVLSETLTSTHIKMNSLTTLNYEEIHQLKKTTSIDVIIITIYQPMDVLSFLMISKSLKLLDVITPVYVFSKQNRTCAFGKNILELAWEYNVLSTLFICLLNSAPTIFTFNPYANYAPQQWLLFNKLIKPNKSTKYFYRYYEKGTLCQGLDFDRTRYFNKSITMKLGIELEDSTQRIAKSMEWRVFCSEAITVEIYRSKILDLLKKNLGLNHEAMFINYRTIKKDGYPDVFKRAYNSKVDLILFDDEIVNYGNFTMTYPYKLVHYKIVALDRGLKNFLEHIYHVLGLPMVTMMGILIILTFFVVWLTNKKKSIAFACFEVVRLIIDAGLETKLNTASLKIFFMVVLFYFMIIQTLFQGELPNFFANPLSLEYPSTLDKLVKLKYRLIYVTRDILEYMKIFKTPYNRHIIAYMPEYCHEFLFNYTSAACVLPNKYANFHGMFHMKISGVVHSTYRFYMTRDDSPIKYRINQAFLQVWELGFGNMISEEESEIYMGYIKVITAKKFFAWKKLRNRNLRFMYIFLGSGLSIATLSFFLELIIHKIIGKSKKYSLKTKIGTSMKPQSPTK